MMKRVKLLTAVCVLTMMVGTTTATAQVSGYGNTYVKQIDFNKLNQQYGHGKPTKVYAPGQNPNGNSGVQGTYVNPVPQQQGGNGNHPTKVYAPTNGGVSFDDGSQYVNTTPSTSNKKNSRYTKNQIEQQVKSVERYDNEYRSNPNIYNYQKVKAAKSRLNTMTGR